MLARTGKIQHNMENKRNPGELIGIIEDECVPGATLPRAEPEEWSCSDGFSAKEQKLRERNGPCLTVSESAEVFACCSSILLLLL